MADIFLSYAREDEARIQPLISAFTKEGWSVFWDRHIPAGQTWRSHIGQALGDAKCVIVAWTRFSVVSSWVSEEADVGRQRGVLVPILLDTVEVPIGFRSIQVANLTEWAPGQNSPRFEQLLDDINALMAASPIANTASYQSEPGQDKQELPDRSVPRAKKSRQRSIVYAFITVILILVLGGGYWKYERGSSDIQAGAIPVYQVHDNKRLQFSISYPVNLLSLHGEAADGLSQRFVSRDGRALLILSGAPGRSTADLPELYLRQSLGANPEKPTRVVTYKIKKENWFVVSGFEQSRIWYEKTIGSSNTVVSFRLEYEESQRQLFDLVAGTMAKSFAVLPASQD